MEPVFMVRQSSATAAVLALDAGCDVQAIDYGKLRARLEADNQILQWTGPKPYRGAAAESLPGIVVDGDRAELVGSWGEGHTVRGYIGNSYLHDEDADKGKKRAVFTIAVPKAGKYEVRFAYTALGNRAINAPVTVTAADGEHRYTVNQKKPPEIDGMFHSLTIIGVRFRQTVRIVIETTGTVGHVIVDAVQLLPVR